MPRYLRQKTSGHIYIYTDALAKRLDMEDYEPEVAEKRIRALQTRLAELQERKAGALAIDVEAVQKMQNDSHTIAQLERQIRAEENALKAGTEEEESETLKKDEAPKNEAEILEKERQERIEADVTVQRIKKMRTKAEVQEFMLIEFATELDPEMSLKDMKDKAVEAQVGRIFE